MTAPDTWMLPAPARTQRNRVGVAALVLAGAATLLVVAARILPVLLPALLDARAAYLGLESFRAADVAARWIGIAGAAVGVAAAVVGILGVTRRGLPHGVPAAAIGAGSAAAGVYLLTLVASVLVR